MMIWIPEEERFVNSDHIVSIDYELREFSAKPDAENPDGKTVFSRVVLYLDTGAHPIIALSSVWKEKGDEAWKQMIRLGEIINGSPRNEDDIW